MMTATEHAEARLAEQQKSAEPATTATPKPEVVKPAAPASRTSADRYTVTCTLDPHVHKHFADLAEQDERSLPKYLARHLRKHVDEITAKKQKDEKF